jgi:sulfopyruvate decarboxylase TPP-binding subunit
MDPRAQQIVIETLREEQADLVVTLPEESSYSLIAALRQDPSFTVVTVSEEGHGLCVAGGAYLGGRRSLFVCGVIGLIESSYALFSLGVCEGVPLVILASLRGDIGDRSGIPGYVLAAYNKVGEPLLRALQIPYRIVSETTMLQRAIRDAYFSCEQYSSPIVIFMTGEVLGW